MQAVKCLCHQSIQKEIWRSTARLLKSGMNRTAMVFYVLYAVNNDGEESLYLYDSVEHTYQRMETPKSAITPDKKSASKFDAILEKISDHLIWFVAAAAVIVILLVIFLLVSVVKLHNRNRKLDDLYDEYELDDEPQRNPVKPIQPVKAEKKSQFKKETG